jgi:hypothetical protein
MMIRVDLYEPATILGHSNFKMAEMQSGSPNYLKNGGRTADAGLFRAAYRIAEVV